jgi:RecG-like helicase
MSWWEPTTGDSWGGLPVVRKIADAGPRSRLAVAGEIVETAIEYRRETRCYRCDLDDGTGAVTLLFSGRSRVRGLEVGARCYVEGTSQLDDGRLVVWNPIYRLERGNHPCDPCK